MGTGISNSYNNTHGTKAAQIKDSLKSNIQKAMKEVPYNNGYFGMKRSKKQVTIHETKDPVNKARKFYDKLTHGYSSEKKISNGGYVRIMKDGTAVTFRKRSISDGSPAVDINVSRRSKKGELKSHKIHFVRKDK